MLVRPATWLTEVTQVFIVGSAPLTTSSIYCQSVGCIINRRHCRWVEPPTSSQTVSVSERTVALQLRPSSEHVILVTGGFVGDEAISTGDVLQDILQNVIFMQLSRSTSQSVNENTFTRYLISVTNYKDDARISGNLQRQVSYETTPNIMPHLLFKIGV